MKTFYEWLELNEAGFLGNLFGKKPQPVQQPQVKKTDDEFDSEGNSLRGGPPKPGTVAAYGDFWNKTTSTPTHSPSPSTNSNVSTSNTSPSPSTNSNVSKSDAKLSLFKQLYEVLKKDPNIKKYYLDEIKARNNGSLKDEDNKDTLYRLYRNLSRGKCDIVHKYSPEYSLPMGDLDKAISIMEQMFKSELNARFFPEGIEPGEYFDWREEGIRSDYIEENDPYDGMKLSQGGFCVLVAKGCSYPIDKKMMVSRMLAND